MTKQHLMGCVVSITLIPLANHRKCSGCHYMRMGRKLVSALANMLKWHLYIRVPFCFLYAPMTPLYVWAILFSICSHDTSICMCHSIFSMLPWHLFMYVPFCFLYAPITPLCVCANLFSLCPHDTSICVCQSIFVCAPNFFMCANLSSIYSHNTSKSLYKSVLTTYFLITVFNSC